MLERLGTTSGRNSYCGTDAAGTAGAVVSGDGVTGTPNVGTATSCHCDNAAGAPTGPDVEGTDGGTGPPAGVEGDGRPASSRK